MVTVLKDVPTNGVEVIPCRLNGPRGIVKAFLLHDDASMVLVDTGFSAEDGEIIAERIRGLGRSVSDLDLCVITHHHGDHVGGLKALRAHGSFPLASHPAEAERVASTGGVPVDRLLNDGDRLDLAGGIRVFHVPGHTPGSIALYAEAPRALVTGDAIFSAGEWLIVSPGYLAEDPAQARASVERVLGMGLPIDLVLVAHGEDVYSGAADQLAKVLVERREL